MASGKPIVASEVGEVRQMLNGCGILTKPGDAASLADGIMKFLNDKMLCLELGQKARKRTEEKYNWSTTAEQLLNAYQLARSAYRSDYNQGNRI
jgi:glycosyltransferase involved in cell wall biosynthesis